MNSHRGCYMLGIGGSIGSTTRTNEYYYRMTLTVIISTPAPPLALSLWPANFLGVVDDGGSLLWWIANGFFESSLVKMGPSSHLLVKRLGGAGLSEGPNKLAPGHKDQCWNETIPRKKMQTSFAQSLTTYI